MTNSIAVANTEHTFGLRFCTVVTFSLGHLRDSKEVLQVWLRMAKVQMGGFWCAKPSLSRRFHKNNTFYSHNKLMRRMKKWGERDSTGCLIWPANQWQNADFIPDSLVPVVIVLTSRLPDPRQERSWVVASHSIRWTHLLSSVSFAHAYLTGQQQCLEFLCNPRKNGWNPKRSFVCQKDESFT